ncbi:MAG TPA: zinc metallopeptidase, partial [Chitinophagaceae bacterium]|nr:zinc metallopeptidase [Chitinophagaceae bacterium]
MSSEIFIVSLVFLGISFLVSAVLKQKFTQYSKIGLANGLSGREIAEKMLRENGIYDVKVVSVEGFLSDHYNPANKTVNLSPEVYNGTSVSAAAVAAHECGHAVQHATQYGPLVFRSKMVPAVKFSSMLVNWILLAGMVAIAISNNPTILLIGIIVMSITVL